MCGCACVGCDGVVCYDECLAVYVYAGVFLDLGEWEWFEAECVLDAYGSGAEYGLWVFAHLYDAAAVCFG